MVNGAAMGLECAAMTAESDQIGPARVSLPGVPAYLRSAYELGRRSLRPGLPALAVLFFYHLGMGAYAALKVHAYPPGRVAFGIKAANIAGLLLFFVLTPFLIYPLQESLLRGRPLHFLGAIRRVLERSVNCMLSGIAQALVLLFPGALVAVLGGLLRPDPLSLLHWTTLSEILFASFFIFMIFATPAVVLDGEGPLHSMRTSYHLVSRNLGSTLGRLLAWAFLAMVAYEVATIPSMVLSRGAPAPIKLATVILESAASTLALPFWLAAVLVLYRSLRPWTDEGRLGPGRGAPD